MNYLFSKVRVVLTFLSAFSLIATSASVSFAVDTPVLGDPYYVQIQSLNYDYTFQNNRAALTIDLKVRYHANPVSFVDLMYITAPNSISGCQHNAPSTFTFGLSTNDVMNKNFNASSGLNQTSLISRSQDGEWKVDEYKSTSVESGFGQDYYDYISKCGPRILSDIMIYDVSGKSPSISMDGATSYQFNLDRGANSPFQTGFAPYDSDQLKCPSYSVIENNLKQVYQTACTHSLQLSNYPISYSSSANPAFSISAIAKAAADKAAADKAAADKAVADKAAADKAVADKAVADKAVADKAVADKAAARASTNSKTTITCQRGKMVKRITGVKPLCPVGFRKNP